MALEPRSRLFIDETFAGPELDARLRWHNPPSAVRLGAAGLTIEPTAGSDFWQRTHYGFVADSGHALLASVEGDFRLETAVAFEPVHQYDQAGLLIRLSPACWLKTSIEFEAEGPSRLGSVVTNDGWSDWATQNVSASLRHARYRITRQAGDYLVEHAEREGEWSQLRVLHLREDDGTRPVAAGLYACSPKGAGFRASFGFLRIERLDEADSH